MSRFRTGGALPNMTLSTTRIFLLVALSVTVACGGKIAEVDNDNDSANLRGGAVHNDRNDEAEEATSPDPGEPNEPQIPECGVTRWQHHRADPGLSISDDGLAISRTSGGSSDGVARGSTAHTRGHWYFEVTVEGQSNPMTSIGIAGEADGARAECGVNLEANVFCSFSNADGSGGGRGGGDTDPPTAPARPGDVIGVAVDLEEFWITYTRNGQPFGPSFSVGRLEGDVKLPMQPNAQLKMGNGFRAAFSAFQYPLPEGYLPWECAE